MAMPKKTTRTRIGYKPNSWEILYPQTETVFVTRPDGDTLSKSALVKTVPDEKGWRPPKPYMLNRTTWTGWTGTTQYWQKYSSPVPVDVLITEVPYPYGTIALSDRSLPTFPVGLKDRAEVYALLKLKDQGANYSVTLLEMNKSVRMIGGRVLQLAAAIAAAKKRAWKTVLEALGISYHTWKHGVRDISGRWLELQYGWLPILQDIQDIYDDARQGYLRRNPLASVVKDVKQHIKTTWTRTPTTSPTETYVDEGFFGCKVRLDYILNDPVLAAKCRVGLTNPLAVAWELGPWTFLLDWFVPIGDWLSSLDATTGFAFKAGSCTTYTKLVRNGKISVHGTDRSQKWKDVTLSSNLDHFSMNRTVYSKTPVPTPFIKNPVSVDHALNALALLGRRIKTSR